MSVSVTFHCNGCFATAEGTDRIRQEFRGITGRPYGFGHYHVPSVTTVKPEGWVAFDSCGATYCPSCADDIWPERREPVAEEQAR